MRNYDPFKAPTHFKLWDLLQKFDKTFGASKKDYGSVTGARTRADIARRRSDRWNFLFIAGMWFQDLFNYDFRRTERCIIPYARRRPTSSCGTCCRSSTRPSAPRRRTTAA
jgi:uncharacterized radical SAM superfamily Fe-S cluster-containing enzyme